MAKIDYVPFPPTSFPHRDLLVLEQLPLGPADRVCELGVGAGGTTARLARRCGAVTGFEISADAVRALRPLERRYPNLELVVADVTDVDGLARWAGGFTRLVSCDTVEHVPDPAEFFRAVATLLAPGGAFLVTFPNEPRARMHGVTRFASQAELRALLEAAGLGDCRIGAARLSARAAPVAEALGFAPVRWVQRALGAVRGGAAPGGPPQTFERTRFFRDRRLWTAMSPLVNLYWYGVLKALPPPAFEIDWGFSGAAFEDCQVVIAGTAPERAAARAAGACR
jgi:SAM-dependent methyltransferase